MRNTLMLSAACALLCLASCKHEEEKEEEVEYTVTSPEVMDTSITKQYVAQIRSIRHIEIRAQERGYLQKIFVDEGQTVQQGQMLFQIMPTLYNAEVQKAQAEADFAGIEYKNTKGLADSNIVAPGELAMSKAKLSKAQAELALAQVHRNFTELRAPFSGIVDKFVVKLGSLVDEGDLLTNLSDNSEMWVYFNVPEAEYLDYKTSPAAKDKMVVQLKMANNEYFPQSGIVETIEADFNNENGNIAFRATFPNPNNLLRNGETGNVESVIPIKKAIIIPQKATFEVLEKKYVYVVGADSIIHSREITLGADMEDLYQVTAGLKPTDKILLEGLRKVREGQRIHYKFQQPKDVFAHLKNHAE